MFIGDTPVILRKYIGSIFYPWRNKYVIEIKCVSDFYENCKNYENYEIWSGSVWTKIKEINSESFDNVYIVKSTKGILYTSENQSVLTKDNTKIIINDCKPYETVLLNNFPKDYYEVYNYYISNEEACLFGIFRKNGRIEDNKFFIEKTFEKSFEKYYNIKFPLSDVENSIMIQKYLFLTRKELPVEIINSNKEVKKHFVLGIFSEHTPIHLFESQLEIQSIFYLMKQIYPNSFSINLKLNKFYFAYSSSNILYQVEKINEKTLCFEIKTNTNTNYNIGLGELICS